MFFIRTSPVLVFHAHTCILIACLHTHCMLAYSSLHLHHYTCNTCILCTWMLSLFHLHWDTYSVHVVVQVWWKCQCVSVSVEVSVFKGFSGRTLRNAFGKTNILQRASVNLKRLEEQNCILVDLSRIGKPKFIHSSERVALLRVQNSE